MTLMTGVERDVQQHFDSFQRQVIIGSKKDHVLRPHLKTGITGGKLRPYL